MAKMRIFGVEDGDPTIVNVSKNHDAIIDDLGEKGVSLNIGGTLFSAYEINGELVVTVGALQVYRSDIHNIWAVRRGMKFSGRVVVHDDGWYIGQEVSFLGVKCEIVAFLDEETVAVKKAQEDGWEHLTARLHELQGIPFVFPKENLGPVGPGPNPKVKTVTGTDPDGELFYRNVKDDPTD